MNAIGQACANQASVSATFLTTDKNVNSLEKRVSKIMSLAVSKVTATSQLENANAMKAFMARGANSLQMISKISAIRSKKNFNISLN